MAKGSKDSEVTVSSRMQTSGFQHAQKKDTRYLINRKDSEVSDPLRMKIPDLKPETLTVPPGIPAEVWLGVARMKHMLQMQNLDLAAEQKTKERKINFVKDVLEVLFSVLPEVANAMGRRRNITKSEAIDSISAMATILQSYVKTL
jgi:hypothetical protein